MALYTPTIHALLQTPATHALDAGTVNTEMAMTLSKLRAKDLFDANPIADMQMAEACLAGLWLYFDEINRSHDISQNIPTATGSYWHMIMHRRELDFGNAMYWVRQTGDHPIEMVIAERVGEHVEMAQSLFPEGDYSNAAMVRAVQSVFGKDPEGEALCKQLQAIEWDCLFEYCYKSALGINY